MIVGVLKEARPGETRVAATPASITRLLKLGYDVIVEQGAGIASGFTDAAYTEAGAIAGPVTDADIVIGVNAPSRAQLDTLKPGATVIAILSPRIDQALLDDLARRPITALAMDAVPRISRAQSLDVLSSMANIAGYRAVMEAAHVFGRFFTGQVTAAGKVPPAKVLVVGAGVAGLAAIGVAGSLGAIVHATDPRPEVADQVASLGGAYLSVDEPDGGEEITEGPGTGYAKEMSEDYSVLAESLYARTVPDTDIVITTALIPGRPAPRLITAEMVASMQRGSVIVDMAAANGGNVEGTIPGEEVVTANGVTIIGYTDLAGRLPAQASQLYSTNVANLLALMTPDKDGHLVLDLDDMVIRSITVTRYREDGVGVDGSRVELLWPPPPVEISTAPVAAATVVAKQPTPRAPQQDAVRRLTLVGVAAVILFVLVALAPAALQVHLTVFALAIVIGYYVIGHVHHALHTPLMSVTNAISGIIVVGALLQVGHGDAVVTVLSSGAVLLASINVFGGFAVTRRMLAMFTRN